MPVRIDSHVHIMPPWRLKALVRWILKAYPNHPVEDSISATDILSHLKTLDITHFFNFIYPLTVEETEGLNRFNSEFCGKTPGAIPFASMHPETAEKASYAEKLMGDGSFVGFKFHPFVQKFDPWDKRMDFLYLSLQEMKKPVFFHTGFELFYGQKMPIADLVKLVKRYSGLPMVFVHMAFPDCLTCFDLLEDYPELYLDATNVLAFFRPEFEGFVKSLPGQYRFMDQLLEGIEKHSDRIMYGSDYPVGMGALEDIYKDLDQLSLADKAKKDLRIDTAQKFVNRFQPNINWDLKPP